MREEARNRIRNLTSFLLIGLLACSVCLAAEPLPKPMSPADYKAPADRSPEMQAFDKAVLFLSAAQEPDGHWDAAKSGAAAEFSGINGDIAITALAANALTSTSKGKLQNRDALARAKRGLEWLLAHTQPDGHVADESATGEPVMSQLLAALTFLQAASLSTRPTLRDAATNSIRYGLERMAAPKGGYGTVPNAQEANAEVTAMATLVSSSAGMEGIKLDDAPLAPGKSKAEALIEEKIRAGLTLLMCDDKKKNNIFSMNSAKLEPDWDGTIAGVTAQTVLLVTLRDMQPAMKYIYGDFDDKSKTFPNLNTHISWGRAGEGNRAMMLWLGTVAMVYSFSDNTRELHAWTAAANSIFITQQSADGAWDVAGPDAKRRKIWRTALNALTLLWLAPPPPPPPQPPQDPVPATPAGK